MGSDEYLERLEGKIRDGVFLKWELISSGSKSLIMLKYSKITVCSVSCVQWCQFVCAASNRLFQNQLWFIEMEKNLDNICV